MTEKEKTVEKKRKTVHIELSFISLFFWGIGLLFSFAWIFALGVLAGKGLLPGGVETLRDIKTQIARIQELIITRESSEREPANGVRGKDTGKYPKLDFYHELSKGEEEPVKRPEPSKAAPKKSKKKVPLKVAPANRFVVQVASLDSKKKALAMVGKLTSRGYKAYSYKVFVKGKAYYRVRCGLFLSEKEAEIVRGRLAEKEKLKGFVKRVNKKEG